MCNYWLWLDATGLHPVSLTTFNVVKLTTTRPQPITHRNSTCAFSSSACFEITQSPITTAKLKSYTSNEMSLLENSSYLKGE